MPRALIAGGLVLDSEGEAAPRDILIDGDSILDILTPAAAIDAERIDAGGLAIIPGLINAHTHGHGGLSKGSGDRWTLELLLNAGPWIGGHRSLEDRYLSTQLTAMEMLLKGCTACFDLSFAVPFPTAGDMAAAAQAYRDLGMRAVVAPMIGDIGFYQAIPGLMVDAPEPLRRDMARFAAGDGAALLAALEQIAAQWPFPEIGLALAPTIPLHCTDDFLVGCSRIARAHGLRLQTHLAESKPQMVAARARYGHSITTHLHRLGILGPEVSGAHGVWLDDDDMAMLGDAGVTIAHNPGSNLRLGSGIADARALLDRGVGVGIGTDGGASADGQNMFEATRLACNLSRIQGRPPDRWLSAQESLHLATQGSAAVLGGQDRIGRIAKGYKADLVFIDLGHVNYLPLNDLTHQLVHVEDSTAVRRVMVGGRLVVEDGRVLGLNQAGIACRAADAAERLRAANRDNRALAERLAPHVARFCHGLTCGCEGPRGGWRMRDDRP